MNNRSGIDDATPAANRNLPVSIRNSLTYISAPSATPLASALLAISEICMEVNIGKLCPLFENNVKPEKFIFTFFLSVNAKNALSVKSCAGFFHA
jgi:hypothetical protein